MPTLQTFREKAVVWLRQGISPRRLAFTLSLGFVLGCIPVFGLPTGLCALIALAFGLNQPAIQAANYMAMPFQVALIVPLVRLGARLIPIATQPRIRLSALPQSPLQALAHSPQLVIQVGGMAGQALVAWLLFAIPVVVLLTPVLTAILRRVPAVAAAELAD
jgi:hypothetical protein